MRVLLLAGFCLALPAQPRIGTVEVFGLRRVAADKVTKALGVRPGDPLPKSKIDAEERLEAIPGVVMANLEAWCCDEGRMILYVGIEERGRLAFQVHLPPDDEVALPPEIAETYQEFTAAFAEAVRAGDTAEDLSRGHSLMVNVRCRAAQLRMVELANEHEKVLRTALRRSAVAETRATAAFVMGFSPRKSIALGDLQYAVQDADPGVRANAARGLKALAVLAAADAELGLRVEPTWLVAMLHSIYLTDRLAATSTLIQVTDSRPESTLTLLRERAMDELVEMARWQYLPHALPAYLLAGRALGIPEEELHAAWSQGEREKMLSRIGKEKKRKT
jgi:hypothetical protein